MTKPDQLKVAAEKMLSHYFDKSCQIAQLTLISESDRRNLILRLTLANPSHNMPRCVILKQTVTEPMGETEQEQRSRFAHDWAGIDFLTQIGSHHAPQFYGGNLEQQFILLEDLGVGHPSLVGPLTRVATPENKAAATTALRSYITRLGQMHADSFGKLTLFNNILTTVYPQAQRYHRFSNTAVADILQHFHKLVGYQSAALHQEIESVYDAIENNTAFQVLLHGDCCPDNVFAENSSMRLFDFEYADSGHALLDGVYLRMAMPSCWCSKTVPTAIITQMEALYRAELMKKIPAANNDLQYHKALVDGMAYWLIWNLNRWLDKLFEKEWNCPSGPVESDSIWDPQQNGFRPRMIARLAAFISAAQQFHYLPQLTFASQKLLIFLKEQWPDTPALGHFPVFQA